MLRNMLLATGLLVGSLLFGSSTHRELMVHFPSDISELNDQAITELDAFLSAIQLDGDYVFTLRGHTDFEGAQGYNEQLAQARAAAVQAYLSAHGVDPTLVKVEAFGERRPAMTNATEEGMAENRRVQIIFEQHRFADIDELRAQLAEGSVQRFTVDPTNPSSVAGTKGMQVVFPANAFKGANGETITAPVEVQLTEASSLEAMLGHDLSTRSGSRLLETAGMMKVEAFDAQGKPLALSNGSTMQVSIPKSMDQPGMELFTSTDGADWTAVGQQPLVQEEPRVQLPARPQFLYPAFKYLLYAEDPQGKPRKPVDPVMPKAPRPPRPESFTPTVHWWQFFGRSSIERKARKRFERATQIYEEQVVKYEKKVARYEEDCAAMPHRLMKFRSDMLHWDELKYEEFEEWRTGKDAALARHASKHADRIREYELVMQRYYAQVDSLLGFEPGERERTRRAATVIPFAQMNVAPEQEGPGSYIFQATELGWINCDRFYNVPEKEKFVAEVADTDASSEEVYLVFSNLNCVVSMGASGNGYSYRGVPKKEAADVFAYKVQDGRAMVCHTPVRPGEKPKLEFVKSSVAEIRQILRELVQKG